MTADHRDPPPSGTGREGGTSPAKAENHQPRPEVSGGVDRITEESSLYDDTEQREQLDLTELYSGQLNQHNKK